MTDKSGLRIFSYLPNPRLYKATIAARFSGAQIEVIGDKPLNLINWLWDYEARELSDDDKQQVAHLGRDAAIGFSGVQIYKTDAFLAAHPFGNVPAGFLADGQVGVFESNSIMRAAARIGTKPHNLLGADAMQQSRIDSFLDRSLVFARDLQHYLLAGDKLNEAMHKDMAAELSSFAGGLDLALSSSAYVAGEQISLADICTLCDLCQLTYESGHKDRFEKLGLEPLLPALAAFKNIGRHMRMLAEDERFTADLDRYFKKLLPLYD